jgi:glutathione S-transferase
MSTLYFYPGACSLVPHIVSRELGLAVAVKAAPRPDDTGRAEYLDKVSPLGKVPALVLDDGQVITQNLAIVEYMAALGEAAGNAGVVYPKLGTLEHAQALRWLSFANSDLHPAFGPLFRPQRFSSDESAYPMIKGLASEQVLDLFAHVNGEYNERSWIANDQYSAADVYIYVTYRWAKMMGLDLAPYAGLAKMVAALQARPAVITALAEQGVPAI